MLGAIALVVVLVVVIPVAVLVSGAVAAMILSHLLKTDSEIRHEGSELLDLSS